MTKKITKINFYNYKAFYSITNDIYTLDLQEGKNLLIYGENGSGKSSIFEGLKDFFQSSLRKIEFEQNIFSVGSIPQEPFIEVQFSDDAQIYSFSTNEYKTNTNTSSFIRDVNKVKAFISYKDLLRTHFITTPLLKINLFPLLFGDGGILSNISSPFLKTQKGSEFTFFDLWKEIDNSTISVEMPGAKTISSEYNELVGLYEAAVNRFLDDIKDLTNLYLEYFDKNLFINDIKIEINKTGLFLGDEEIEFMKPRIIPKLKFYNSDLQYYPSFLNEARLTALAISIYLAAIDSNPPYDYQILFFDDIFIGLDTNNRIPLLNIIKEKLLHKYQIIFTTYDKYWFEIAKDQLGNDNWFAAEMYIKENINNFQPIIIQSSLDYYDLAKKHFDSNDYPTCGNYQRKACEYYIKNFIPRKMQLQENSDGTISEVNSLETLFNALKKYLILNKLDISPFKDFALYKRLVLNKLSHDDIKSPYYKSELEKMFVILDELKKLKRQIILNTDESIFFDHINAAGQLVKIDIKSKDNFILLSQGTHKKFQNCPFNTSNQYIDGNRTDFSSVNANLNEIYKKICHELTIVPNANLFSQFKDKNGKLLSDY